jgi:hypothetical protein
VARSTRVEENSLQHPPARTSTVASRSEEIVSYWPASRAKKQPATVARNWPLVGTAWRSSQASKQARTLNVHCQCAVPQRSDDEVSVVALADAALEVRAVVIKLEHASLAYQAVLCSNWLGLAADRTPLRWHVFRISNAVCIVDDTSLARVRSDQSPRLSVDLGNARVREIRERAMYIMSFRLNWLTACVISVRFSCERTPF